jgi:hypothetical protein
MSGNKPRTPIPRRAWALLLISLFELGLSLPSFAADFSSANGPEPSAPATVPAVGDLLQFADGSSLHGKLRTMGTNQGVAWEHPDVKDAIHFRPTNIAWIRFASPKIVASPENPTCRFRFNNGDEVFGKLSAIDPTNVDLETWFGGALQATRQSLQSITFLSKGFTVLYEGPTSADGWVHGKSPRGWEYRDGAFVATSAGTLGKDMRLSGSSSLTFDLAWNGHFSLIMALYTPVLDRFDYSSSSYMFYLSPGYITLQRVQGGAGAINLGQAQIAEMGRKNKLHMEIRANKPDSTLTLLVDDHLVQRWKDTAGFVGQGSGLVFFAQLDGPSIRISNLKVTQWEGEFAIDTSTNAVTKDDLVYLVNHDKVTGKVQRLKENSLSVETALAPLEIPLARVSQITLASPTSSFAAGKPWELRAFFAGGGTVAFQLESWQDQKISGRSGNFGPVSFDPRCIRQLQFNLDRPRPIVEEMEILDQDVWDIE